MQHKNLICFDDSGCEALSLQVRIEMIRGAELRLQYLLRGDIGKLKIPALQHPAAVDGLWRHTCFELFVTTAATTAYREFNFSPSGLWAAYAFSDYRTRQPWTAQRPPIIQVEQTSTQLHLDTSIAVPDLPSQDPNQPLLLGLAAVLETSAGELCYWALRHPAERPDFHHRSAFACILNDKH